MRNILILMLCMVHLQVSHAQSAARIKGGTFFTSRANIQVSLKLDSFINNGTYSDTSGTFNVHRGLIVTGTGINRLQYLNIDNPDASTLNSPVSVYKTASLLSGSLDVNNNLLIRSDDDVAANLVVTGVLTNNVQGIIPRASVITGPCPGYTSLLQLNISGPAMVYQWQSSGDSASWTNITSGTNATYTASLAATSWYRCNLATNNSSYSQATAGVKLTVTGSLPTAGTITGSPLACVGSTTTLTDATGVGVWSSTNTSVATVNSSGVVSGLTVGTTIISYTVTNSCGSTAATTTVLVNPLPTIIAGGSATLCNGSSATLTASGGSTYSWSPATRLSVATGTSITASPSATTNYTVTGTSAEGCSNTDVVTIAVNPIPTIIAGGGATICNGSSVTLTASGGSTFTWSPATGLSSATGASIIASPSTTTTYSVTGTSVAGCSNTATTTVTIIAAPVPDPIGGTTNVCTGSSITLTESTSGGTWASTNNAVATIGTTGIVSGISSGTTTISYTISNTCGATAATVIFQVNPVPAPISNTVGGSFGNISTFAGTGLAGFTGDGGPATSAQLSGTSGFKIDAAGNMYIADRFNHRIRKVSPTGVITTIAGNGSAGYGAGTGDGGAATATNLNQPIDLVLDPAGNIFIADYENHLVRKVNTSGIITTVAGNGSLGYSGDGGAATSAMLYHPTGIALDNSGNIYIANRSENRIRKVNTSGIISTVAGNGIQGYIGDGMAATASELNNPTCITFDDAGNMYIGDVTNHRIRKVNTSGIISTIAGSGVAGSLGDGGDATSARLNGPEGLIFDASGNLYIADNANHRIRKVTPSGTISTYAGVGSAGYSGDGGQATSAFISGPQYVGVDANQNIYIADFGNNAIRKVSSNRSGSICTGRTIVLTDATTGGTWSSSNTSIATIDASTGSLSGISTGTVQISYSALGCSTTTTMTINATPSAIGGTFSVCQGLTVTLTDATTGGSWSSSSSVATVGASTGIVTGVSSGNAIITYAKGNGCFATSGFTVNPAPAAITGANSICEGTTTTFVESTTGGSWSSSNTAAGTVNASGLVGGVGAGTVIITYTTINGCIATKSLNIIPNAPITGPASVCAGTSATLSSTITGGLWTSSNTTVATVNCNLGIVNGLAGGTSIITYTLSSGCSRTYTVGVISLLPNVGNTTLCTNASTTLTNSTPGGVWTSNNTAIATVGTGTGIVTGVAPGNVVIAYTVGNGCNVTTGIVVSTLGANLGNSNVCVGTTTTLSNVTVGGTWSTSNASVANVVASTGIVSGVAAGSAIITYTFGAGCFGLSNITVNGNPSAVTVSGGGTYCGSTTITASGGTDGTIYFQGKTSGGTSTATASSSQVVTASGTYYFRAQSASGCWGAEGSVTVLIPSIVGPMNLCTGTTATLTNSGGTGTWMSSSTGVAGIGSTTGLVTATSTGSTTITSTLSSGCVVTANLVVGAAPAITGPSTVCAGQTMTLTNSATGGTWSTSAPGTATVSSTGVVTGVAGGLAATISYVFNTGCRATSIVTVNPLGTISNVIGGANPFSTCIGQTANLVSSITGGTWVSTTGAVATIGTSGVVTGIGTGTSLISYVMATGCVTTVPFTVKQLSPVTGPASVCAGQSITLSNVTGGGTWSTSTPSVANVIAGNGIVTGLAGNLVAPVTYTLGSGCKAIFNVSVNPLPAIGGVTSVCQGATTTLTNTATGGTWSSANSSIATIGTSGIVSGISSGLVSISYVLPTGCTTSTPVNVNPVAAIGGPNRVCQGQQMTLTNSFAGTWSSGAPTVATIGTTGVVTGIATNSATAPITYTFCTGCKAILTVSVLPLSPIVGVTSVCQGQVITLTDASAGGTWSSSAAGIAAFASTNGNVTGVSAGAATVSYALASGCTATFNLTVNPLSPITGSSSVCNGQSITLANTTPGGGTWFSPSSTIATVTTSGVVTGATNGNLSTIISYTTPQGCRATKTVSVLPLSPIVGVTSVCQGQVITLTDANTGGTWSSSAAGIASFASTNGNVTGVSAGAATVSYALASGCTATFNVTVNPLAPITGPSSLCNGQSITLANTTPGGGTWFSPSSTIATVSSAGVVTGVTVLNLTAVISYTTPLGCRATYTVTVNALPTVASLIGGPFAVSVSGAPITLTNTTAGGVWSSSNVAKATIVASSGVVTGVSVGSAIMTYMVTNAGGCSAYVTKAITVGPAPMPHSSTVDNTVTIEVGGAIVLSETTEGGAWYCSDGEGIITLNQENGQVTGIVQGRATVSYTVTDGNTTTLSTTRVIVNPKPESVTKTSVFASVILSPNPNKGDFTLSGSFTTISNEVLTLTVMDMLGQVVYTGSVNVLNNKLDERTMLSNTIARGSYILSLQTRSEKKVIPFVVE